MDTLTSRFTNCSDTEGIGFYYTYNGKGKLVRIEMKAFILAQKTQYPERRCSPKRVICTVAPKLPTKRNI